MAKKPSGKPKGTPKGTPKGSRKGKPKGTPVGKPTEKGGKASGFKIVHVLKDCIGCGACASISTNWKAKGEKFVPKKTDLDKLGKELLAAESCPVNCIHLIDNRSKKKLV